MEDIKPALVAPPPWSLSGRGVVLLYRVTREFNAQYGFMEYFQGKGYIGGLGAVMLVEYRTSPVGPYFELLYMPGFFKIGGKMAFSISKIYVSTYESVWNGRENWGIPKEPADFTVVKRANGELVYEVEANGHLFFEAQVKPFGPEVPFSNKFMPLSRIVQQLRGQLLLTHPVASGHMRLAKLLHVQADSAFFPPLQQIRPLATLSVQDFRMSFPRPYIL
jgi:hypothetical protein